MEAPLRALAWGSFFETITTLGVVIVVGRYVWTLGVMFGRWVLYFDVRPNVPK